MILDIFDREHPVYWKATERKQL